MGQKVKEFYSFLKRYRYRGALFQAFLGHLVTLKDRSKNDLVSFLTDTKIMRFQFADSNSFRDLKNACNEASR